MVDPEFSYVVKRSYSCACCRALTCVSVVILVFCMLCLAGQEPQVESHAARLKCQQWYNPPPPEPDPRFLILPVTADRVLRPVPRANSDLAISKLANIESVELTRVECERLGVPFDADQLIENE